MLRHPQWQSRLYALIAAKNDTEFEWGVHDCCTWGADVVEAVTGTRPALPTGYGSPLSAARELKKVGGLEAGIASFLGESIEPAFAQRGDIGVFDHNGDPRNPGIAVCLGAFFMAPGLYGLERVSAVSIRRAWRV